MPKPGDFVVKDSGHRLEFESGMRRDVTTGKPRYDLVDEAMFTRIAHHYGKGAEKYSDDNWRLANSPEEWRRFRQSAFRHFMQWWMGDVDEDHAAAVFFNIAGAEYVQTRLGARPPQYSFEVNLTAEVQQEERHQTHYVGDSCPGGHADKCDHYYDTQECPVCVKCGDRKPQS